MDGEYGFAFNVTATFANGTVTTPALVDVFATDIGAGGGFATNADPFTVQDPATLAIYNAAVPEPSALSLGAIGILAIGASCVQVFRRRGCGRLVRRRAVAAGVTRRSGIPKNSLKAYIID